jgi:hypothetical protein
MKPDGDGFADAVLPAQRRARLQAAPPASRVATAIAARRAYGPPLTPQPLRPLTAQRHGQAHSPCPPEPHGARLISRSNPYKQSLYGLRGLPLDNLATEFVSRVQLDMRWTFQLRIGHRA